MDFALEVSEGLHFPKPQKEESAPNSASAVGSLPDKGKLIFWLVEGGAYVCAHVYVSHSGFSCAEMCALCVSRKEPLLV